MDAIHDSVVHGSADEACREVAPPARRKLEAVRSARREDDLRPARGIIAGMILGAGLWIILLTVGWLIFR
jgi:hypothetical protein